MLLSFKVFSFNCLALFVLRTVVAGYLILVLSLIFVVSDNFRVSRFLVMWGLFLFYLSSHFFLLFFILFRLPMGYILDDRMTADAGTIFSIIEWDYLCIYLFIIVVFFYNLLCCINDSCFILVICFLFFFAFSFAFVSL